jgi:hypothetical protein
MTELTIKKPKRPLWINIFSIVAILFGMATILEGVTVLFTEAGEKSAGNYVPFVLWFNFLAGFIYILAGTALYKLKTYSRLLVFVIAISTSIVFILFGFHIFNGGAYEIRTVAAMTIRSSLWILIAVSVLRTKLYEHYFRA